VEYDLRRDEPYGIYDRFRFRIPTGTTEDCMDRLMMRVYEIDTKSAGIIRQALQDMPEGDFRLKSPPRLRPKGRDVYHRIESAQGELGFISSGTAATNPTGCNVRAPSFVNLMALPLISRGGQIAGCWSPISPLWTRCWASPTAR